MKITQCHAYKIKDSREESALEVEVCVGKICVQASIPTGKSTGSREAVALVVDEAIKNVNEIITPKLIGQELHFFEIDKFLLKLDGTENKSKLGANTILGVSIAVLKLEAQLAQQPLWQHIQTLGGPTSRNREVGPPKVPRLFVNVLNGGVHAGFNLPFQEYLWVLGNGQNVIGPIEQMKILFEQLEKKLKIDGKCLQLGDEGGFTFDSNQLEEPFQILSGLHNHLAVDVSSGEFFDNDTYHILGREYSSGELLGLYENLVEKFPIVSWEDPFSEDDFGSFVKMTEKMGADKLIVGDDLTTTNPKMIKKAIDEKLINTVLIKPNQIGTISETLEAISLTHQAGLKTIISHRSGETMDSFIADLAIGVGAYGIKTGAPSQLERLVKYDRLAEIEKEMDSIS